MIPVKLTTKNIISTLIFAYSSFHFSACMRSRRDAIENPTTLSSEEPVAKDSDDEGTLSVITNLFSDSKPVKPKLKPPLSRVPFKHLGFYEAPSVGKKSFKWEAKIIQSEKEIKDLEMFFTSQQLSHKLNNLKEVTILALMHTGSKANSAIRVSQVKFDNQIHILSEILETNSNCSMLSSSDPKHYLHLISIPLKEESLNKKIRVDVLRRHEACLPTLKWEQNKFKRVAYKTLYYEEKSKKSWDHPSPRILTLNNNWGEWNLFQKNYCHSCDQMSLTPNKGYLAIIDGKGASHGYGKSHLIVKKIYKNDHYVGVGLKRIVELCPQNKSNQALLLLEIDNNSLKIDRAFTKSHIFRLPSGFIPEDQITCGSYDKFLLEES
ncbi:MAG: hypothetical protein AB8G05_03325 [Oligoflexales bacterium]